MCNDLVGGDRAEILMLGCQSFKHMETRTSEWKGALAVGPGPAGSFEYTAPQDYCVLAERLNIWLPSDDSFWTSQGLMLQHDWFVLSISSAL